MKLLTKPRRNGRVHRRPASNQHRCYDGVLFDIGDTLVHFETVRARDIIRTMCRPGYDRLIELGHQPPRFEKYVSGVKRGFLVGLVWSKITRREVQLVRLLGRLHRRLGFDLPPADMIDVASRSTVPAMEQLAEVDPLAVSVMQQLRSCGVKLGLVSNTVFPDFAIDAYLDEVNLLEFFPTRVYSSTVRFMKPHRRIFELALEGLDLPPERVLFVGDRLRNDVAGATRAGMDSVLFSRNGNRPRGRRRPLHIVKCLTQIPPLVQRLDHPETYPS